MNFDIIKLINTLKSKLFRNCLNTSSKKKIFQIKMINLNYNWNNLNKINKI